MFEFSIPMPFSKEHIDKVISINKEVKKSKITSLYFSLPSNSSDFTGFEQDRFIWNFDTDFKYWKPLIEYSRYNNFDFIYVLNSPVIHYEYQKELYIKLNMLDKLMDNLRTSGVNKIRICNPQLMGYINKNYPEVELYISTSTEIKIIKEYINLFSEFENIKNCVPSFDVNKNFRLLKNLRKLFPEIKLELMVNEGCIPGCPLRVIHNRWSKKIDPEYSSYCYSGSFFMDKCAMKKNQNIYSYLVNPNIIYPWEIKEYLKIGINHFKLVGRNNPKFITGEYLIYYEYYLKGIDNMENVNDIPIRFFNNYIHPYKKLGYTVKEIRPYLPDIKHFEKRGHLCAAMCSNECNYCSKHAEKMQKALSKKALKKEREEIIRTMPVCVFD